MIPNRFGSRNGVPGCVRMPLDSRASCENRAHAWEAMVAIDDCPQIGARMFPLAHTRAT